jgi:hypothetical protein
MMKMMVMIVTTFQKMKGDDWLLFRPGKWVNGALYLSPGAAFDFPVRPY